MNRLYPCILFLILCTAVDGQEESDKPSKLKFFGFRELSDTISEGKSGLFILPLLYYTPDTRWAFGAAGVYYFRTAPANGSEKETRMSNMQFLADYTQNRQFDLWGLWNIFTRNENYLFKGEARFRNFPDRFYGIGNNSLRSDEEWYEYNLLSLKTLALKQVKPALFLGADYHIESEYRFRHSPGGALGDGTVPGYKGGIGSALGLVATYDNRDNIINTYNGRLAEVSSYFYSPLLGSSFSFQYLNLVYQHFWRLKGKQILAWQSKARLGTGDIPFLDMSTAGNDDLLRGYPKNRFRDKNFIGTQVEYRLPLFWRLGAVAFAGAGDVFETTRDLEFRQIKYSVGGGLRLLINPAERLNIRMDYGYGREGGYFYFMVAESF